MQNIYDTILDTYYKVLKINLETEEFEVIKILDNEQALSKTFSQWCLEYAYENVHPMDIPYFISFMNSYNSMKHFNNSKNTRRCYYRRRMKEKYHWVCAELHKTDKYNEEEKIVLLTIKEAGGDKEIEDALAAVRGNIVGEENFEKIVADYQKTFPASLGLIVISTYNSSVLNIVKSLFTSCYESDVKGQYVVFLQDATSDEFGHCLMRLHAALRGEPDYHIGACWSDDEDYGINYLFKMANYKIKMNN